MVKLAVQNYNYHYKSMGINIPKWFTLETWPTWPWLLFLIKDIVTYSSCLTLCINYFMKLLAARKHIGIWWLFIQIVMNISPLHYATLRWPCFMSIKKNGPIYCTMWLCLQWAWHFGLQNNGYALLMSETWCGSLLTRHRQCFMMTLQGWRFYDITIFFRSPSYNQSCDLGYS